jgi:hypothetical protein
MLTFRCANGPQVLIGNGYKFLAPEDASVTRQGVVLAVPLSVVTR